MSNFIDETELAAEIEIPAPEPTREERAGPLVLAWLIRDPGQVLPVMEQVPPDMWPTHEARAIARAMLEIAQAGRTVGVLPVIDALRGTGRTASGPTPARIHELHREGVTEAEGRYHLGVMRAASELRAIRTELEAVLRRAQRSDTTPGDVAAIREAASAAMLQAAQVGQAATGGPVSWEEAAQRKVAAYVEAHATGRRTAYSTGLVHLDEQLSGGLRPGELVIIAARPGMGKSALALDLIERRAAPGAEDPILPSVLLGSFEMLAEEIAARSFYRALGGHVMSEIDIRGADARAEEVLRELIADKGPRMRRVRIVDNPSTTVAGIEAAARAHRLQFGELHLVIVDYLQLIKAGKAENRVQEISTITRALKNMAQSLRVPVVALSQLSRAVEQRPDKRPQLSDLRESGSIEQDADKVLMLWRPAYYGLPGYEPEDAFVLVEKHRNGACGKVKLCWDGDGMRFENAELGTTEQINLGPI